MATLSERLHVQDFNEKAHRAFDGAKDVVTSKASSLSALMREHPMATIAIGLCAGYLIALATRRR